MPRREYYISKNAYLKMDFMNEVPEIVCDILYHLARYVHYRTDRFSEKAYKEMLQCQHDNNLEKSVM